ncbi:2'-5' RNA ligase family protein [Mucilaginibacter myungsuensis]|uniref:2'-5' RNA ligase family protein n=1 Tax=Mucilaginibacter myungsuensis TaxID=649104 RepID=A0A929L043_9SPHI|nr:2'-5' RNA ligase family protein [Mucilaginibacter myungsuensis]MBE9663658.1 2'-5' RNA ligase family protein [Mucilaginibacter myungsuensis]MDN3599018.1 2'-5' RNA ligase family protein [Mucilaginibacter myungsuensis]
METYTDYLMLLELPKNLMYDIGRYKRASARVIGNFPGLDSAAHISLNHRHRCKPNIERHGISQIGEKLAMITPMQLQVYNFKYFTHGDTGYTIYACIVMNEQTQRWFKAVQNSLGMVQKITIPHITIVKNISPEKFQLLWPKFAQSKFSSGFIADKLTVLERETYVQQSRWKRYKDFKFGEKLMQY